MRAANSHLQGLAALANVAMHELEETRTDPYCCGYWDASGEENADKCGWTFGRLVTLSDGSQWKVQVCAACAAASPERHIMLV